MGSFSSKMHLSRDGGKHHNESETEVNSSGTAENSTAKNDETGSEDNSENATSGNQEQNSPPKVRQSFSWLVDTPVVLTPTGKEQKGKGKKCVERKEKASSMLKYTNEKYLKSCHQFPEIPPSDTKRQLQFTNTPSSSSSSSSVKNIKYSTFDDGKESGKASKKRLKKANQPSPSLERRDFLPSTSGFRPGFGADGKQNSHSSSSKTEKKLNSKIGGQ